MVKYSKIEKEIDEYVANNAVRDLKIDTASAIVKMPVAVGKRVFNVSELSSIEDIPNMPERIRDFAFRMGTEYKTNAQWSVIYGVHPNTIQKWRSRPDVVQVIAMTRFERRSYMFGQMVRIERLSIERLTDVLNMPLKADTAAIVLDAIKFVFTNVLGNGDQSENQAEKREFNLNIGLTGPGTSYSTFGSGATPYSNQEERDVTPEQLQSAEQETRRAIALIKQLRPESGSDGDGDD